MCSLDEAALPRATPAYTTLGLALGRCRKRTAHSLQLAACLSVRQVLQGGDNSFAWGNFSKARLLLKLKRLALVLDQQAQALKEIY